MTKKEYMELFEVIERKALDTHVIGATSMALELKVPIETMQLLDRESNSRRSSLATDIEELEYRRINEGTDKARDWDQYSSKHRKCVWLAHDLVAMTNAITSMVNSGHKYWFAHELEELQDRVCDREFELQYRLIAFLPKSVREI